MTSMDSTGSYAELEALLEWYSDQGVDLAVEEHAQNRFAPAPEQPAAINGTTPSTPRLVKPSPAKPVAQVSSPERPLVMAGDEAVQAAQRLASSAASLDALRTILETFEGCSLKTTANRLVFADGKPGARVMIVGEAPGADEDREGVPFCGRSGKLLDRMLAAIGLDRTSVYIAYVVPWRPPGNRSPTPQETAVCLPFIRRQIELCGPDLLVCLGSPAALCLLGQKQATRGRWGEYQNGDRVIKALPTLSPVYLLRQPMQKRLAWRDLLSLRAALDP